MTKRPVVMLLLTGFLLVGLVAACANTGHKDAQGELLVPIPQYGAAPLIRVKLTAPTAKDSIQLDAGKAVVRMDGKEVTVEGPVQLKRGPSFVSAGDLGQGTFMEITPATRPEHFSLDGRTYRGILRLYATTEGWEVINVVDLEQYVAGVIGWEMIASWPVEALKAQAVASRTYAVFTMEESRDAGRNWDLDDSTRFQVYGGVGPTDSPKLWRETANVLAARSQTTGLVLTYQGKGFKAFFHSTSGGHTTDPRVALGIDANIEPLGGVDLGEFDKESPKANWEVRLAASEVNARLIEKRIDPRSPIKIEPEEIAPSGHAITVRVYGPSGHSATVSAIDLRMALGIPSTHFKAERSGDEWVFTGKGYGHGCGMCQWSARGMAKQGWDSNRILKTMYPGSELKTLY